MERKIVLATSCHWISVETFSCSPAARWTARQPSERERERAKLLGIPQEAVTKLADAKLATFGQFAFITGFQPGSSDKQPFIESLSEGLGNTPDAAELASWRRL